MGKGKQCNIEKVSDTCICCEGSGKVIILGPCPLCDGVGYLDGSRAAESLKQSNKAAKQRARDISQSLSMLLRHSARDNGIAIDQQGWVLMEDALRFINIIDEDDPWEGGPVTIDEVCTVVETSDKSRFAICKCGPWRIRASQGHTMKGIDPDLDPLDLNEVPRALHGTYFNAWDTIRTEGLNKMGRNHIHMAKDLPGESGVISGMRSDCQVLIWIDLVKASVCGITFLKSANGVILSEGLNGMIPPEFFDEVRDRETMQFLFA